MKLYFTPNSPYARVARVALRETGLIGQVTELVATLRQPNNPVLEFSPVGRVPVLVTDDVVITEVKLIYEYLAEVSGDVGLFSTASRDWRAAAQEGLILGFLEGIVAWVRENRRDPPHRSAFLQEVEQARAGRCLSALNAASESRSLPDVPCFRGTALASALSLMDLHDCVPDWRANYQPLAKWFERQAERPSMKETAPRP